ncbi:MAG: S-layer homology domain-containing protein, partial [Candidatus Gracilibacteria bacterium]
WDSYPVVDQMPPAGMRPALYGSNYIVFEMPEGDGDLKFELTKSAGIEMGVSFVPMTTSYDFDLDQVDKTIVSEDDTYAELVFDGASRYQEIYVIVSPLGAQLTGNINMFDSGYGYYYSADFGDYSESEEVVTSEIEVEIIPEEKDVEEVGATDGVKVSDELILEIATYDDDSVTLSWNRLNDLDIDHYLLYFGSESGNFIGNEEIDKAWTTTSSINELAPGQIYYFMVEAYSSDDELLMTSSEVVGETTTFSFTDLDSGDPEYEAVMGLYDMGIIDGYSDGSFQPEQDVNRAELLKILIEGLGIEVSDDYANCFDDVGDEWYAKYVCYAEEQGWVAGYDDGNFYPAQIVNKVEALKMLLMVYGYDLEEGSYISGSMPYSDTWSTAWYAVYVDKAYDLGILSEKAGSDFYPEEGRNRGEICMELWGMLKE